MIKLILLRHGQSLWNSEDKLSGWTDVDLSEKGKNEAVLAGEILKKHCIELDVAFCSYLKRTIRTLWTVLDISDQMWIPVHKSWHLNERHYGALQGIDRDILVKEYGVVAVENWRKHYHEIPPVLPLEASNHPRQDKKYKNLADHQLPNAESLAMTWKRIYPYWHGTIVPHLLSHKTVLVVAHGNVLRTIYKNLVHLSDQEIETFFFINAQPLYFELDDDMQVLNKKYLD